MEAYTLAIVLAILHLVSTQSGSDILRFVDPLIGTVNGGHVFPGATLPFGMAKAVADVNGEDQGGFASDGSNITGFSHLHDSGTGGVSLYECQVSYIWQDDEQQELIALPTLMRTQSWFA